MPLEIVRGTNHKPVASEELVRTVAAAPDLDGQLIIGFPLLASGGDQQSIDAIFVSPTYGAVILDLSEGAVPDGYQERQDELARLFQTRLLPHRDLYNRRQLELDLNVFTFSPGIDDIGDADYPIVSGESLIATLRRLAPRYDNSLRYDALLSAIQNISRLRNSRSVRAATKADSRGARLKLLETSIATLDHKQSKAVIETIEGVQRIRGLAGSGKTVILALKAAYLHAQHPEWRIAVSYNTRSLHEQFRRLIGQFCIEQSGEEPDWDKLRVVNAWGTSSTKGPTGLYAEFCVANKTPYYNFRDATNQFGRDRAFEGACDEALSAAPTPTPTYDAILIDEAQDFPPSFLRIAYAMLRDPKRLVYAYDELQSLDGSGLPNAAEIFGVNRNNEPNVSFDENTYDLGASRDIVLERCYRNSRPVLSVAHALGFGVYRTIPVGATTQLVQMFDEPHLWTDIGYELVSGELRAGEKVKLGRTNDSSPKFLEDHSPVEDLIQFIRFNSQKDQDAWVADQIQLNLEQEELRFDDLVVINPNGITARTNLSPLRADLLRRGIRSHLAGVDTAADVFFDSGSKSVTFTGIHRAKGNEAGMVYVVNAQEGIDSTKNLAQTRNRLFTAITRSKAWVRVLGVGPSMDALVEEFARAKEAEFKLEFTYPTDSERQKLRILHRELTRRQQNRIEKGQSGLGALVSDLDAGEVVLEDFDPETILRLKRFLGMNVD